MGAVGLVPEQPCFYGPLFGAFVMTSPSEPSLSALVNCHTLEVEIGFIMKSSIPLRSAQQQPYTANDLLPFIDSVVGCVELCGSRYAPSCQGDISVWEKLADGLMTGGVYMGPPHQLFHNKDLKSLTTCLKVNGSIVDEGTGAKCPQGGPLESVAWLVNALAQKGEVLQEGQLVISGMTCKVTSDKFRVGDEIEAVLEGLGSIRFCLGE